MRFFPIVKSYDLDTIGEKEAIVVKKLTAIRLSDYAIIKINNTIKDTDYPLIKNVIILCGKKILKSNLLASEGMDRFGIDRHIAQLGKVIDDYIGTWRQKYAIVLYAAQLLQYYTILCNDAFSPEQNHEDFHEFLSENTEKFGNVSTNPFLVEYKLIKIYNDLSVFTDAVDGIIAPIENIEEKARLLVIHLRNLQLTIEDLVLNAPDSMFAHYLNFVINYTFAKAFELNYKLLESGVPKLVIEEKWNLSDQQQSYLGKAKLALDEIESLSNYYQKREQSYIKGLEFSFGQNVLNKLPNHSLDEIKGHVISLRC